MAGGLLNIVSVGSNNLFLTGNPSKTFFKTSYSKYSNFGLQKFRIDYDGLRDLRLTDKSTFTFKIPRYAELLMDTYLVVTIPDIWSPIYQPCYETNGCWAPYEFKWIENLGMMMIDEILITCGSLTIQQYSGQYLSAMVDRDFSAEKKNLFNEMSGNTKELHDPMNSNGRSNSYPNAIYTQNTAGAEPSIRGRNLYIPINTWFTLNSTCAFPLIALQYNELVITVTLKPISELFTIRDVFDNQYNFPYLKPDLTEARFQMYRYLQTPPSLDISPQSYQNTVQTWNADVHLLATYCFLSKEEAQIFAAQDQVYLVKDVFQYKFQNVAGTSRLKLYSKGMVANWMWYLQRDDVHMRNEWNNYTNWPYGILPSNSILVPNYNSAVIDGYFSNNVPGFNYVDPISYPEGKYFSPSVNPNGQLTTGINVTGEYHPENQKEILNTMGIVLNGDYRENILTSGIYNYVEKYTRTQGYAKDGLYCYNFGLNTSPFESQPSGAINLSNFKTIEIEISTFLPPIDLVNSSFDVICDVSGNPIGVRKSNYKLYPYNYNLTLFEERYNVLSFVGGNCGMMYSR
jgi:hypothetical protein